MSLYSQVRIRWALLIHQYGTNCDNPMVMTPAEYLSWLPSQESTSGEIELDDSLWLQMGGAEIPGFNLDGFADTWTAAGFQGNSGVLPQAEGNGFWSS